MRASKFTDAQKAFIIKQGEEGAAGTSHAISSVMIQLGGADVSCVLVINIAANMTGINGVITNALTMDIGTISDLSTTALGAVNTGTIISGVDATVQGIVGPGGVTSMNSSFRDLPRQSDSLLRTDQ